MRFFSWLLLTPALWAETHSLTLLQVAERAAAQNPDVLLARLDEQRAALQVRIAQDPFRPKIFAGSGLAYTSGFPMSIEGSAPSIVQARAVASVINRAESHRLAQTREEEKSSAFVTQARREEAVFRAATLYLDASHFARAAEAAGRQVESASKLAELIGNRISEGREIPLEARRSAVELAKARQRSQNLRSDQAMIEATLAHVLGFPAGDRVSPAAGDTPPVEIPATESVAIESALRSSPDLKRMQSELLAKEWQARASRAERLPRLNLVAQYGLFARFNNYEDFFNKFQRHNGQVGVSLEVPIVTGPAIQARAAQAEIDAARIRTQMTTRRGRIALDIQQDFQFLRRAEAARDVSRMDLDLARESLAVVMARLDEGRAGLKDVEEARRTEAEKWVAYYEALHLVDQTRFALLHRTGSLMTALR